ncbi:MAG TPA: aminoacetone oxidase family FAD-binding enzyme, partial [Alteromonas macleodii]|nr:aminoacetone oxidase family FAD-binding enzyme [Alteromonas macleodii]
NECNKADVTITTRCEILSVEKNESEYSLTTSNGKYECESLV